MNIDCPNCHYEFPENYDTCGGNGEDIHELYICPECGCKFDVVYSYIETIID